MRQGSGCEPGCTVCDSNAIPVTLPGGRFVGTTSGQSQNVGSCGGGAAPEAIFKLALTVTSDVFVNTHGSKLDTVVYMRRACCDMEVACNDDGDGRTTSVLSQRGLGPGTYYIFIDGAPGAAGDYVVDIFATPSSSNPGDACGNPIRITNIPIGGDTCNLQPDYDPPSGCISGDAGSPGSGPDAVYYFVLDAPATITLDTCVLTCMDSVLYVRDVCTKGVTAKGSAAMCNDDGCGASTGCSTPGHSLLSLTLAPGAHYLFVDTHPQPSGDPTQRCGTYTVTPTGIPK